MNSRPRSKTLFETRQNHELQINSTDKLQIRGQELSGMMEAMFPRGAQSPRAGGVA
jgi:hypothetical protein